jgi:hypothetical protein
MAITNVSWRVLRCQLADRLKMKPREIDEIARESPQDIRDYISVINAEALSQKMKHDAAQRQAKSKSKGKR